MAEANNTPARPKGGQFKFPNPSKRSPAQPSEKVESNKILGLYNVATGEDAKYISEKVRTWFTDEAGKYGWHSVNFIGDMCILTVNF